MNQELWKTVWDVSQKARSLPPGERLAFVRANCPDPEAVAEVEALLAEPSLQASNLPSELEPPPAPLKAGSRIGRYTVTGLLGRGAMGDTFRAQDDDLGRPVAIKLLRAWHGEDRAWQQSIREARAASALNHPNIVMVFEVLHLDCGGAIVMELVSGRTLRHWCGTAQAVAKVAHYGRQLALALEAAHTAGIIHRDVKPENIMVRDDGYLKLLDFGLARSVSETMSTGRGVGTLRYMSPEQARARPLTPSTDVFSLGIILFELLTGAHPFGGQSNLETLGNIVSGKPPELGVLDPNTPAPLRDIIGRMLARNPEDRPQAGQVAGVLAALAGPAPVPAGKLVWPRVAAVASLAAIGVAVSTWALKAPPDLPKFYQFTRFTEDRYVTSGAISPDGLKMIFMDVQGDVRLRDIHGTGNRVVTRLPNTQPDQMNWIAQTGKVLLNSLDLSQNSYAFQFSILDLQTGSRTILPVSGKRARPSPDGRRIVYLTPDRSEIWVSDLDGGNGRRLAADRPGSTAWVEWSADGRQIHYYAAKQAVGAAYQWQGTGWRTVDLETGALLGVQPTEDLWPGYMQSTGRLLLIRGGNGGLAEASFDERGRFRQPARPVSGQSVTGWLSASADGSRIAALDFSRDRAMVHVAETQPGNPRIKSRRRLTTELSSQIPHAWTPDNQGVIFESRGARDSPFQIYIQGLDAQLPQPLSPSQENQVLPSVSPDGRWVLFLSGSNSKNRRIQRAPLLGGASQTVPTGGPVLDFGCLYKAKRCVLREVQGGQAVFYDLDPIRGQGRELSRVAVNGWVFGDWSLSPDGKMVVFADSSQAPAVLRIVYLDRPPLETSVRVEGPAPMGLPVWTAAGDGWYLPTQDYQLRLIGWDGRNRFVHDIGDFAIPSGDGKRLAFLDHVRDQNVWILER